MGPNTMDCDTPTALLFFASAANKAESEVMRKAASEIENLRLTDAEREAVEECVRCAYPATHPAAATLRGLLKRLEGN